MKNFKRTKVFVAMSGGVDSSVAAYLLCDQGYDVVGVYMKNWSEESFGSRLPNAYCPWKDDVKQVKSVCRILGIPMKIYNFEREYAKEVIDPFFSGQEKGNTPNPDIRCNRAIKFGIFINRARQEGADMVATGHYVMKSGVQDPQILPARDKQKDQSYFLCTVARAQLKKAIFPLGAYKKAEVRKIAEKAGFPNAQRAESMGICFVGEVKMDDFLKTRIKEKPGDIIDTKGNKLGRHKGLVFYTIGQRQGLRISGPVPYYVSAKEVKKNRLVVALGAKNPALFTRRIRLKNFNWQKNKIREFPFKAQARIRYRQPLQACTVYEAGKGLEIEFRIKQRAVTPGQYCAIYFDKALLGGGEIVKAVA